MNGVALPSLHALQLKCFESVRFAEICNNKQAQVERCHRIVSVINYVSVCTLHRSVL